MPAETAQTIGSLGGLDSSGKASDKDTACVRVCDIHKAQPAAFCLPAVVKLWLC